MDYNDYEGYDQDDPSQYPHQDTPRSYTMEYADTPWGTPTNNPGAPGSKTDAINSQWKAWGDPWVEEGDTGGYLGGVGVTIGPGRSTTPGHANAFLSAAQKSGIDEGWLKNFLGKNPGDFNRLQSAYQSELKGGAGGAGGTTGGGVGGGVGGTGGGSDALSSFLAYLQGRGQQEDAFRESMRGILMGQLGALQRPVSAEDPGIASVLAARRLASQRAAERSRIQAVEEMARQGLRSSGALNARLEGITQSRGESDTHATGQILYQELQNRRNALQNMLSAALSSGDAMSAQAIQAQLQTIQAQLQNSQFNDTLGFNYNQLTNGNNNLMTQFLLAQLAGG